MSTLFTAAPLIVTVSIIVAALAYLRTDRLADPKTVAERGRTAAARQDAIGFGVLTLVAGTFGAFVYHWLDGVWHPTPVVFAVLGIGAALALSAAAAIVRPKVGLGGVREVTAINLLCGLAYGVGIPILL